VFNYHCYPCLTKIKEETIPGFDVAAVESRIKNFVTRRCGDSSLLNDSDCMAGVRQYMVYVLTESLESAGKMAIVNHHANVVPGDIRIAVVHDPDFLPLFKSCKMLWYGRG
jgi:hypothetical protein